LDSFRTRHHELGGQRHPESLSDKETSAILLVVVLVLIFWGFEDDDENEDESERTPFSDTL
jgi:hypothetical protein